ncbi:hypothetical protein PL9214670250 [Planktothrix tepida PCC 9214]|uniref:Uncharacterized protein n=1 Tax=Planktothrix tepida PCC 9214 TaxID=671072 RepID=A0A1J1LSP2_9CYAN|nr:hypothetical protein PL9214670250 [Planktothrix tepida PCC 9214]
MGNWLEKFLDFDLNPFSRYSQLQCFDNQSDTVGIAESLWNRLPYFIIRKAAPLTPRLTFL